MRDRKKLIMIILAIVVAVSSIFIYKGAIAPKLYDKYLNTGIKYLMNGQYEEAILAFDKAIKIEPKTTEARVYQAKAYVGNEELDKAVEVLEEIQNIDKTNEELLKQILEILNEIENSNSISIHIRRGDYMSPENYNMYGCIATPTYYKKAIKVIEEKVENPTFFVFSNDMDWVKKNIQINSRVFYIDINSGNGSYKDMQLMSNCKHNIIANSSFSWWGAWLNENKNKIVIAPKKWINREDVDSDKIELFCEGWTLL